MRGGIRLDLIVACPRCGRAVTLGRMVPNGETGPANSE